MHFREDTQTREHRVTQALVSPGPLQYELMSSLELNGTCVLIPELDKATYGKIGDVDIAIICNLGQREETICGIEVKVMHLTSDGRFKSKKEGKHVKQIRQLEEEGWDRIYLLDVIVTDPAQGWLHSQSIDGIANFEKECGGTIAGHLVMQINSVAHKPETDAGSASCILLKQARFQGQSGTLRPRICEALRQELRNRA